VFNHERIIELLFAPQNADILTAIFANAIQKAANERLGDIQAWQSEATTSVRTQTRDSVEQAKNAFVQGMEARKQEMATSSAQLAQALRDLQATLQQGGQFANELFPKMKQAQDKVDMLIAQAGEAIRGRKDAEGALASHRGLIDQIGTRVSEADRDMIALNGKVMVLTRSVEEAEANANMALTTAKQARAERPYKNGIKPLHAVVGGVILTLLVLVVTLIATRNSGSSNDVPAQTVSTAAPTPVKAATPPPAPAAPKAEAKVEAPARTQPAPAATGTGSHAPSDTCFSADAEEPPANADGTYPLKKDGRWWTCGRLYNTGAGKKGVLCGCH
jgi:ABC-type transporter Mla subunit MlaD